MSCAAAAAEGASRRVTGGRALAEAGAELVRNGSAGALAEAAGGQPDRVTAADVLQAANTDADCAALVERAGRALGLALAGLVTVLAPEVVVFGGGIAAALARLRPWLDRALAEYAPLPPKPRLVRADFDGLAGAVGAAVWASRPPPAMPPTRPLMPTPVLACADTSTRAEEKR